MRSAAVNRALPPLSKFRSVNMSENARTPGLLRYLRPLKWIISAVNPASFVEEHTLQLIESPFDSYVSHQPHVFALGS